MKRLNIAFIVQSQSHNILISVRLCCGNRLSPYIPHHHSNTDNQQVPSDWRGSWLQQMAIYGEESEMQSWEDGEY